MKSFYIIIVTVGLFLSCYVVYPQKEFTKTNQKDYIDTILSNSIGSKNLLVATNVKFLNNKGLFILNAQSLVYEAKKMYSTYPQMLKYIGEILINNDTMIVEEFYSEWKKKNFRADEVLKDRFVDEIALQEEEVFLQYFLRMNV